MTAIPSLWYEFTGQQVHVSRVSEVDLANGTAFYEYRQCCTFCRGKGENKQFYKSQCRHCKGTGYSFTSKRQVFTLDALFKANRQVACIIYREIKKSNFELRCNPAWEEWMKDNTHLVEKIKHGAATNTFLKSLSQQIYSQRILTAKQLEAAKRTLHV